MRSKAKAHRVPCGGNDSGAQVAAGDTTYITEASSSERPVLQRQGSGTEILNRMGIPQQHPHSSDGPVYIPEDINIPSSFDLRESQTYDGLGIWTKKPVAKGSKFGPFTGVMKEVCEDASSAWEIVNSRGEVKGWIDASEPESGNWLKYVRSCSNLSQRNVMAVQCQDEIFYKATEDIQVGCELLLFNDDAVVPENEAEETQECHHCGHEFSSLSNLTHHQRYSCMKAAAHYASMQKDGANKASSKLSSDSDDEDSENSESYGNKMAMMNWAADSSIPLMRTGENGERVFSCENCDKVFTDPSNLQRHIRSTHVGARCHACPECGKTFATSSGLKQHQHIHSSVKPFQCEVCMKAYTQFSNLCRHKRMHADCRQQIKCKDCGQAFSTVTSLSKHQRFCDEGSRSSIRPPFPPHSFQAGPKATMSHTPSVTSSGSPSPNDSTPRESPQISPISNAAYLSSLYNRAPAGFPPLFPPNAATLPGVYPFAGPTQGQFLQNFLASYMQSTMQQQKPVLPPHVPARTIPLPHRAEHRPESEPKEKKRFLDSHQDSPPEKMSKREHTIVKPEPIRAPTVSMKHSSSQPNLSNASVKSQLPSPQESAKYSSAKSQKSPHSLMDQRAATFGSTSATTKKKGGKDHQPLDLSNKCKSESSSPNLLQRIAAEQKNAAMPDLKFPHHAFPFNDDPALINAMMLNPAVRDKMIRDAAKVMSTLLPPGLPFPHLFPNFMQPMAVSPSSAPEFPQKVPQAPPTPTTSSPLLSSSSKVEPQFTFNNGAVSNHQNKNKEKYACKYCGKVFPRSANLTRHLRTHTGEQPYKCKYCERSFSISSNLQRHVRNIHNKEKPFKCHICDRRFGQQTNLDRHLMKHELNGSAVPIEEDLNDSAAYREANGGSCSSDDGEANYSASPVAV